MSKMKVGVVFGGKSQEHEVSKMTKDSIIKHIDRSVFDVIEIYIDRYGILDQKLLDSIDIAFLAVHGANVEDGKLQSYLEEKGVKYTGSGIEASAINMDKARMHKKLREAGLRTVKYFRAKTSDCINKIDNSITREIAYPCFLKSNNAGSSIGITKVNSKSDLLKAINEAAKYDSSITIEEAIEKPLEVEVAILGNDNLLVSNPGEILSNGEFYSYEHKYFKPFDTSAKTNKLSAEQTAEIKRMAAKGYRSTGCKGYARVDFFVDQKGLVYLNEINTLPGFTKTSMFPKLMAQSGIAYKELITRIIELALV